MSRYATISELSPRELEVAALVTEGLSNPAIARRLYLSRPTIAHHVAHILAKLGFASRVQIAAWVVQQRSGQGGWPPAGSGGMVQPDHSASRPAEWSTRPMWASPPDATVAAPLRRKDNQRSMPMTSEATSHLDLTLMVAFHDAFRRDLGHLARAASRRPAELDEPARRTAVLAGWELFKTQLHIHHTAEDHDLWPRMRTHLADRPDELALLQAMQDEHARIDPLLDAVDAALADRDGGHQRLGDTVDELASQLHGHLGHEERDVLPLIDRSLTQAEWEAFGDDQRRRTGIRGAAQFLPWLLDGASPEQAKAVLGGLPPPLRVVYRRVWRPRYVRHDHWEPSTPV
jgi:DNA-binding CsgD family transcriptional regulator/iron-sulfur cluster repair protein YtfE (RIC family)